ncbi:hypothetical protein HUU40_16050 [candidate division KSB1 bacterium]|nr:hypothetical protein [candidate division KSB1 bacterium]
MESSQNIGGQIVRYVKALDTIGRLLTAVSLLPTLISIIPGLTGFNISIPIWLQSIWFILAFGWANLRIFESQSRSDFEIRLQQHSVSLKSGWLKTDNNHLSIDSPLRINFSMRIDLYNHDQLPVDVKISIRNVESNWKVDHMKLTKESKVKIHRQAVPREAAEYNPFNIAGRGIAEGVLVQTEIPFNAPGDKQFADLASLSNLGITLAFEQAGRKIITRRIDCDIDSIKESAENEMRTKILHNQALVHHGLVVLKEFWLAMNKKDETI